jgi:hypothetical protein
MKKHFFIAIFFGFLAVWWMTDIRMSGKWGGPRNVPVSKVLILPFENQTQITVYKHPGTEDYDDMSQGKLWLWIFRPYLYGLRVAVIYLCIVYIFRHNEKYI